MASRSGTSKTSSAKTATTAKSSARSKTEKTPRRTTLTAEKFVAAVKEHINDKKISPLPPSPWICVASDSYRVRQLVNWLSEQLIKHQSARSGGRPQGLSTYFGGDLAQAETNRALVETLSMPSLFEPYQLLVCYSTELTKEKNIEPIAEAAKNAKHASLILHYPEEKKVHKIEGTLIKFDELKGAALQRWITKEMKKRTGRVSLSPEATEALAARFEGSLNHLSHELDKIAVSLTHDEVCSLEKLQTITLLELDTESFALMHQLAKKDVVGSTALARKLLDQGLHPLQIVGFLSRCYRTLLARPAGARSANRFAGPPQPGPEIHPELTNYYFRKNVESIASLISPRDLVRSVRLLSALDQQLKVSRLDPETQIELATVKLATRRFESVPATL